MPPASIPSFADRLDAAVRLLDPAPDERAVDVVVVASAVAPFTGPAVDAQGFAGEHGSQAWTATDAGPTLLLGVGEPGQVSAERIRALGARLARAVHTGRLSLHAAPAACRAMDPGLWRAFAEGFVLARYRFAALAPDGATLEACEVLTPVQRAEAATAAAAVTFARDLVNLPPARCTPLLIADILTDAARAAGVSARVIPADQLPAEGYVATDAIARAGSASPCAIELTYRPADPTGHVALVGKAVTFDAGGLTVKRGGEMRVMKEDMAGAAIAAATCLAAAQLRLPVTVDCLLPATENMPGPQAVKPGDVIRYPNGVDVEVVNPDAEGRLVLADGLIRADRLGSELVVDIGTLTGGYQSAIGPRSIAVYGDAAPAQAVVAAAARAGEFAWALPLRAELLAELGSTVADFGNIAPGGGSDPMHAALLLRQFVKDTPWAHLDIGYQLRDSAQPLSPAGATGFGALTVLELLRGAG